MSLASVPTSAAPPVLLDPRPRWNLVERIAFRFFFCYFILYILPFPIGELSGLIASVRMLTRSHEPTMEELMNDEPSEPFFEKYITKPYKDGMDWSVLWVGKQVFKKELEYRPLGSGDTTWNYVQIFAIAFVSATLTLLWTLTASLWWRFRQREQPAYPYLHEALHIYVRFYLAYYMVIYGSFKVIKLQFPSASADGLLHTYGESSPMHLLWTFMGASEGYNWFTGGGEVLGGFLLCFRRTTLLGALVSCGVMVHVAALNFCYDVPVKLFSMHLVLASLFVMSPDWPWLFRVFVLGQRTTPRGMTTLSRWKWLNWSAFALRTLVVGTFLTVTFYGAVKQSKVYGDKAPQPPMSGLWDVAEFTLDGNVRPPLTTDAGRWQRFVIVNNFRGTMLMATTMTGGKMTYLASVDDESHTIVLSSFGAAPGQPPTGTIQFTKVFAELYLMDGEVQMFADGKFGKKQVRMLVRHVGDDKFLLKSRGFHWINEWPYNFYGPRDQPPPKIPPPPKPKE
ncbi:MAG TPA: hypothetical protein VHR66_11545 [Gemmataceae bacterium]|jgi:hypothetical protein|nr:hypothetical protein [Gemmataceae bacterium]